MTLPRRTVTISCVLLQFFFLTNFNSLKASQQSDDAVALTVSVMDEEGRFISGLQQSDFTVVVNNVPQPIISFRKSVEPLSVGILLDASGSILSLNSIGTIRKHHLMAGVARFLELDNPSNEYFVIGFSTKSQLLLDWTSDHNSVVEKLGSTEFKGPTALYDACYPAIQKLMQGHYPRHIAILISDGMDNTSKHKFTEVRDLLKNSDVLLYSIGIMDDSTYGSDLGYEGQSILEELSYISGGKAFFPRIDEKKSAQANEVFELISNELSTQYTVVVRPEKSRQDKKWRSLKVKIAPQADSSGRKKHLIARTRQGYFQN
jgi:Ca-activated chloride channel family protein